MGTIHLNVQMVVSVLSISVLLDGANSAEIVKKGMELQKPVYKVSTNEVKKRGICLIMNLSSQKYGTFYVSTFSSRELLFTNLLGDFGDFRSVEDFVKHWNETLCDRE